MANRILSIEIGNRITRVVETDFKAKNPKIYKSFSFETPQQLFEEEKLANTEAFKELLWEGLKNQKIKTKKAVFILSSSRIASRDVVIPKVKDSQILTLLYANSAEYFPVDLQQYQLVYRIIGEVEEEGEKKHKLMVLAVPHDMIETYRNLALDCELSLEALDYVGNAATQILMDKISEKLYAAVRIEDDTTLITIIGEGGIRLQRTFSYGIEEAVAAVCKQERFGENLSFIEALNVLRKDTFCDKKETEEDRELAEDLEESFRAIIGNVSRVINFYSSNNAGAEMESIILYGMGADVQDLENVLREELTAPVTNEQLRSIIVRDKGDANKDFFPSAYAACVGAAVEPMDFRLSEEEKKKKKEKKKEKKERGKKVSVTLTAKGFFKICVLVAVLLLLAVVPYYAYLSADIENMKQEKASKQQLEELRAEYESTQKECDDIARLYQSTETTSEGIGAFILEMEKKLPSNISVRSLTSDSGAIILDFNVKSKREAAKVLDEMASFESISSVEVQGLEEYVDELNNVVVSCMIYCTYVGGTADETAIETTMEEDVDALSEDRAEQSASQETNTEKTE